MPAKTPPETTKAAVETGVKKTKLRWDKALVASFLAGAYIALAGLLAVVVSSGLDPELWGSLPTFITGTVFSLGLILVVVAAEAPLARLETIVELKAVEETAWQIFVGAALFVAFAYWYLYARAPAEPSEPGDQPPVRAGGVSAGRVTPDGPPDRTGPSERPSTRS
jgi:formate/nitrite transporter